jgi:hypothetical protein
MAPPSPKYIPPSPIAKFPKYEEKERESIRMSYNSEAWQNNRKLKLRIGVLDLQAGEKKLCVVDQDIGEAILRGDLKLPDQAMTTPVKKVLRDEEERDVDFKSKYMVKAEWQFREEHRINLCRALRKGRVNCIGCQMGIGCEWDGPMGDLLRAHGNIARAKRPSITNNQIRFGLYRFYVHRRFEKEIEEMKKEGDDEPRIPLPLCVETEIKRKYHGGKLAAFVGFKKRKEKENTQQK